LLESLTRQTKLTKQDLERLYDQFQTVAVNGQLSKTQFQQGLRMLGATDDAMVDQFFVAFDDDHDGQIDFQEFACGLSVMHNGTLEERLELAFRAYDLDHNGVIDRLELSNILKSTFKARGFDHTENTIQGVVNQCFEQADSNRDGWLDCDEFKQAVLSHQLVVQSFWTIPL